MFVARSHPRGAMAFEVFVARSPPRGEIAFEVSSSRARGVTTSTRRPARSGRARCGLASPSVMRRSRKDAPRVTAAFDLSCFDRARAHTYARAGHLSAITEKTISIADARRMQAREPAMTSLSRARCRSVAGPPQTSISAQCDAVLVRLVFCNELLYAIRFRVGSRAAALVLPRLRTGRTIDDPDWILRRATSSIVSRGVVRAQPASGRHPLEKESFACFQNASTALP